MKLLNDIPTKYIIAIDIETVRIEKEHHHLSDDFQSAWSVKNKQEGVTPDLTTLIDRWSKTASLYPEFSKVCAVSLTFLDTTETKLYCKEIFGEDEVAILTELKSFLDRISQKDKNNRLIGHAAKFFDYPYLCKRFVINDMDIPDILDTAHLKPWETKNLCTNQDIWKMGGTGSGSSLQALCTCLGIPISKVDLVGDEVGESYFRGELKRIATYCSLDTIATFNIVRKTKREKVFSFEEVVYLDSKVEVIKEATVLEKIYNSNFISPEIKKSIKQIASSFPNDPKERASDLTRFKEILMGCYVQTEFENGKYPDTAQMIAAKSAEIDVFLKTL